MLQNNEKTAEVLKAEKIVEQAKARLAEAKRKASQQKRKEENQHKYMMGGIVHKYFPECYQFDEQELNRIIASGMKSEHLGIMELWHYARFYFKNRKQVENGESLFFYSKEQLHSYNNRFLGVFFLMIVVLYVMIAYTCWKMAMIFGVCSFVIFAIIMAAECYRQGNEKLSRTKSFWFSVVVGIFAGVLWICVPMLVQSLIA